MSLNQNDKAAAPALSSASHRAPPAIPDHEMIRKIGSGSYGEVWLARSIMGTYRAVKVIYRANFEEERPFEREFTGIQKFEPISRSHESQVDILHVGRGDGYFYYVMELADAAETLQAEDGQGAECKALHPPSSILDPQRYTPKTLHSELHRRGKLPFEECLHIVLSLTTALEHLHKYGLVHRDIKPPNVIFVNGIPKLADIGLVTSVDASLSVVGTEGYMPPEGPGKPQGDIYSLGKVLYEICTGRDRQDFPELPTNLAEMPERDGMLELNAIIAKACRNDLPKRYQSATEMHAELLLVQSGKSVQRLRTVERRLQLATRIGTVAAVLALIATCAYLLQRLQTQRVERLGQENQRLVKQSREQLVRLNVSNGVRLMDEGDLSQSLLWLAEAWKLVENDPPQSEKHRIRFESVLRQCPKLMQICVHHKIVLWCEFSPDGTRIVTASGDHTAQVWNAETGEPIGSQMEHADMVNVASFSPDGKRVITASDDGTARIWDASTGRGVTPPLKHRDKVTHAAFSLDGNRAVTASLDGTARVWNPATGEPVGPPLMHEIYTAVFYAMFSPDGREVLTASSDMTARVWDAVSGLALLTLRHSAEVFHAEFSPDGTKIVTACGEALNQTWTGRTAQIWDSKTGEALGSPMKHEHGLTHASFSPDGQRVVTTCAEAVRIWDANGGQPVTPIMKHLSLVRHAAFSPDGRWMVSASHDGNAMVWDADSGELVVPPLAHAGWVMHATFSPDGCRIVTGSDDQMAKIWSLVAQRGPSIRLRHQEFVASAHFSPDGQRIVTGSGDGTARVWDTRTGTPTIPPIPHLDVVMAEFSRKGNRLLTVAFNQARFWDSFTAQPISSPLMHESGIASWDYSADGSRLATSSDDGFPRIWNASNGQPGGLPFIHSNGVAQLSFSPDGGKVAVLTGWTAEVWDLATGKPLFPPLRHERNISDARFSPDGRRIVTVSGDQTGRVWDSVTGRPITPPFRHGGNVFHAMPEEFRLVSVAPRPPRKSGDVQASFSPDSQRVITAGLAAEAHIWDAATGEQAIPPLKDKSAILRASFSPDGKFIVTCSAAGARLWDAATGEAITVVLRHPPRGMAEEPNPLRIVEFSPSECKVLSASGTKARIWDLEPTMRSSADLFRFAELLSGRQINRTGGLDAFKPDELQTILHLLKSKYASAFADSPESIVAWRKQEAEDGAELLASSGMLRLAEGQWKEAAAQLSKAADLDPQNYLVYFSLAPLLVEIGDIAGYERLRQIMLVRFNGTNDPIVCARIAKMCLLLPLSGPAAEVVHKWVDTLIATGTNHWAWQWFEVAKGLDAYREGHFAEAIEWVQKPFRNEKLHSGILFAQANMVCAMAHQQMGHYEEARLFLADVIGRGLVTRHFRYEQIFLREAKALIQVSVVERRHAWAFAKANFGPEHPKAIRSMNQLAQAYSIEGRQAEALAMYKEAVKLAQAKLGGDHPETLISIVNLAEAYGAARRFREALPWQEEALRLRKASLGAGHADTIFSMNDLAFNHRIAGRLSEAIPLLEEALRLARASLGTEHFLTVRTTFNLANAYAESGRASEAIPLLEHAVKFSSNLESIRELAYVYRQTGKFNLAEPRYREYVNERRKETTTNRIDLARGLGSLGECLLLEEKYPEAEAVLRESLQIYNQQEPTTWERFKISSRLGMALFGQKKYGEAEPLVLEGYQGVKDGKSRSRGDRDARKAAGERIVQLYAKWGKPDLASVWKRKLSASVTLDQYERTGDWSSAIRQVTEMLEDNPKDLELYQQRANSFAETGLWREAAADFSQAVESGFDDFDTYSALILANLGSGDQRNYETLCEKVIQKFRTSTNFLIVNASAWHSVLSSNKSENVESAVKLAEASTAADPRAEAIHTLGTTYYRAGRFPEALKQFQLARSKGGEGPVYDLCESMVEFRLGNHRKAQQLFERAAQKTETTIGGDAARAKVVSPSWQERLKLQLLRQEAEALIGGTNAPSARSRPGSCR